MKQKLKNLLIEKILKNGEKYSNIKIFEDSKNSITYAELLKISFSNINKIKLIKDDYIPILVDRNLNSIIAILSIIFSKKTFCPISPSLPNKRKNSISDSKSEYFDIDLQTEG